MGAVYGGIEAGGTKFICAVGTDPDNIVAEERFPTTTPDETITRAIQFFQNYQEQSQQELTALGIGSFGPVDTDLDSPTYGSITSTPKPGWGNADFAGTIEHALDIPVGFDTDVNAAALAEHTWGAAVGVSTFLYLTIGTGIGGGGLYNERLMHGLLHPEIGHMYLPQDRTSDSFRGCCPFHCNCLEGLASGPAIRERWGMDPEEIPAHHNAWDLEAHYLALAVTNLVFSLSPQMIILGGGVMQQSHLFPKIRREVKVLLNNYVQSPVLQTDLEQYIVPPELGDRVGVLGAIALARQVDDKPLHGD